MERAQKKDMILSGQVFSDKGFSEDKEFLKFLPISKRTKPLLISRDI